MKRKLGLATALGASLLALSLSTGAEVKADATIYRLYNPRNGEHLYTTDRNERDVLYTKGGWGYEGEAWYAPDEGTPVYRLYNARLQNHLYTSDLNEINVLTTIHGWTQDNDGKPLFYSGGEVSIYRLYNHALRGLHHWTTDVNEYNVLPKHGWKQEGETFKATRLGLPVKTQFYNQGVTPPQTPPAEQPKQGGNTPKNDLPNSGTYKFKKKTAVRGQAKVSAPIQFYYDAGQSVFYDQKLTADGHTWISYVSNRGARRYIQVD